MTPSLLFSSPFTGKGRAGVEDASGMAFLIDDMVIWLARNIKKAAEAEMLDESAVRESLLGLQMRLEMGEITEEEYQIKETELMDRLEDIRKYKEENLSSRSLSGDG